MRGEPLVGVAHTAAGQTSERGGVHAMANLPGCI